jgi:hypothetical protein
MLTYSRGEWNAVVTPLGAALFAEDMPTGALGEIWQALGADPGPGAVIGGLIGSFGSSLSVLPSFAAAFYDVAAGEVRLMVRGSARARVTDTAGAEQEVAGLGVSTWTERAVANPAKVELRGAGDDGVVLPLRDGVVAAGRLTWVIVEAGEGIGASRAAEPVEASGGPSASSGTPEIGSATPSWVAEPVEASGGPSASSGTQDASSGTQDVSSGTQLVSSGTQEVGPGTQGADSETRSEAREVVDETMTPPLDHTHAEPEIEATTGYDDLVFGETRLGTVEDAAVREAAAEIEIVDPLAAPEQPPAEEPAPEPTPEPAPEPAQRTSLITGIPGATAPVPPQPAVLAPPATTAGHGDHDGETVSAEHVAALSAQLAAASAPTPPAATTRAVPTLVVSTGERVSLDRSAVVGRRPRAVRATGAIPHLVAVPSPNQDISRNHVELRAEGADIVATDLGTTNGTWLLRTGVDPVRLQPGDAALLVTGDRLDLGEGVVLSFEGL